MVRLSWDLCRLYNALAERTRRAERRRAANRAAFEGGGPAGPVHGQGREPAARLPYGNYTMNYNGCEVVACHNALLALGEPSVLGDAAAWFERTGIFLAGRWGTHVLAIPRFFEARGIPCGTVCASGAKRPGDWDAAFAGARAGVFSFWNSARDLTRGVHTVALAHGADGGLVIYNLHDMDRAAHTEFRSLAEFVGKSGCLPILLITLWERTQNNERA